MIKGTLQFHKGKWSWSSFSNCPVGSFPYILGQGPMGNKPGHCALCLVPEGQPGASLPLPAWLSSQRKGLIDSLAALGPGGANRVTECVPGRNGREP